MKGYVEIYRGSIKGENLIYSDPNMIVDGAAEHVVDILTALPSPSSLSHIVQTSSIADFGIKAITLGAAQGPASYTIDGGVATTPLLSIPPSPLDTTLQPPVYDYSNSGPGKLGHFLNYLNFSATYSNMSELEIRRHGCYVPSGGMYANAELDNSADYFKSLKMDHELGAQFAVTRFGKIFGWGGEWMYNDLITHIPTAADYVQVEFNSRHPFMYGLAVTSFNTLQKWATPGHYAAYPITDEAWLDAPTTRTDIAEIALVQDSTTESQGYALTTDGSIFLWGYPGNTFGGQMPPHEYWIPSGTGFSKLKAPFGPNFGTALSSTGALIVWGRSNFEDLRLKIEADAYTGLLDYSIDQILSRYAHVIKSDGSLKAYGNFGAGHNPPVDWSLEPIVTDTPAGTFTKLAERSIFHSPPLHMALSSNGAIKAWGEETYDLIANTPTDSGFTSIAIGQQTAYAVSSNGEIVAWGNNIENSITDIPVLGPDTSFATLTGHLNSVSAINSDGYILESKVARASQTLADASGGFIVSGIGDVSSTREVKYILTLSRDDWFHLTKYYGGIGSIGLWTLDREATLDKYNSESETAGIDLYNVADVSRNPVFKLFSKKVFLPGGLRIDETSSNDDYITITWGIKF